MCPLYCKKVNATVIVILLFYSILHGIVQADCLIGIIIILQHIYSYLVFYITLTPYIARTNASKLTVITRQIRPKGFGKTLNQ